MASDTSWVWSESILEDEENVYGFIDFISFVSRVFAVRQRAERETARSRHLVQVVTSARDIRGVIIIITSECH